ncbi:hypothetical protein ACFLS5_04510 [Candidatus Bipolaricaulota bacterium]
MKGALRWIPVVLLTILTLATLSACTGFFRTNLPIPTIVIGRAVNQGGRWEVRISVANMPAGGLAGIAIKGDALATAEIDRSTLEAVGLNGFEVLFSDFVAPAPEGALCASNHRTAVEDGEILVLTFQATGAAPTIAIDGAKVELGSNANTLITTFDFSDIEYYTK